MLNSVSFEKEKVCCLTVYQYTDSGDQLIVGQSLGILASMAATAILNQACTIPGQHFTIYSTNIPWGLNPEDLSKAVKKYMGSVIKYHPLEYNTYYHGGFSTQERDYELHCLNCDKVIKVKHDPCPHCKATPGSWDPDTIKRWEDTCKKCIEYNSEDILTGLWSEILPYYVPLIEGKRIYL